MLSKKILVASFIVLLIVVFVVIMSFLQLRPEKKIVQEMAVEEMAENLSILPQQPLTECEKYNQRSKLVCLALVTGNSSYCDEISTQQARNISFFSEGVMKESCNQNLKIFKGALGENLDNFDNLETLDCSTMDEKGKSICLALKSRDVSKCENIKYQVEDEVLDCKALISKDTKYCEMIDEANRCPLVG